MFQSCTSALRASSRTTRDSRGIVRSLAAVVALITVAACGSDTTAPRTLTTIDVTPSPATVLPGQLLQFTATGKDQGGSVVAITPTWNSTGGGSIDGNGLFTAGTALGTFADAVQAKQGNVTGSSSVTVTVVGDFTLHSVDGKAPPDTVINTGTTIVEFLDGTLSLHQDETYKLLFHTRTTTNGTAVSDTSGSTGTYAVNGQVVTLHNTSNSANVPATISAPVNVIPTISFTDNSEVFVFDVSSCAGCWDYRVVDGASGVR